MEIKKRIEIKMNINDKLNDEAIRDYRLECYDDKYRYYTKDDIIYTVKPILYNQLYHVVYKK